MKKIIKNDKKQLLEMMGKIDPSYHKRIDERMLTRGDLAEFAQQGENRPLSEIAREIYMDWGNVNYAAAPYLEAMATLYSIDDMYYQDSAKNVVLYFLSNASSWRGEKAKEIKKELKSMVGLKEEVGMGDEKPGSDGPPIQLDPPPQDRERYEPYQFNKQFHKRELDRNQRMNRPDASLPSQEMIDEKPVDEILGLSKGKKEAQARQQKVEQAKQEIEKYDFRRLFFQPAVSSDAAEIRNMKDVRVRQVGEELPTVSQIIPFLFEPAQSYVNASVDMNGKVVTGYIPANWSQIAVNNGFVDTEKGQRELLSRIDKDELHEEDGVNEIFDWSQKYKYPDNAETYQKLLDTAQKEGHITAQQVTAEYIAVTAKEIAAEFDSLGNDTLWGLYYKEFLTKINKIGSLNLRMNEKDDKWMDDAVKKPGALHKKLGVPEDEKIPMTLINKKIGELKAKSEGDKTLSPSDLEFSRQLNFAKTAKKI